MKKKNLSARELREGKFLGWAPMVVVPLLTLLFWVAGGGKSFAGSGKIVANGFNMRLPTAHVGSIVKRDKLEYYEAAKRDSAAERQRERIEDTYAKALGLDSSSAVAHAVQEKLADVKRVMAGSRMPVARLRTAAADGPVAPADERMVLMARSVGSFLPGPGSGSLAPGQHSYGQSPDLERLERIANVLQRDDSGNTEIAGLTAVLDRLAALQTGHRDTVQRKTFAARAVMTVKALPDPDDTIRSDFDSSAIEAFVPEEQVLVSGDELRLELTHDVLVDGRRIPAGTPVFGVVALSGERLRVSISSITWQDRVTPVSLQVDDEDGLAGIHIPGAPLTDAVRETMTGSFAPTVVTNGLAGQAVETGVNLGRQLIGKKVRPVRVTIPGGYRVLLHLQNAGL